MGTSARPGDNGAAAYLERTRGVVTAGLRLESALDDDPRGRRAAVRRLESALLKQETGRDALGSLMFAAEAGPGADAPWLGSEDAFGSVLLEVQVANVSLSAGAAIGEAEVAQIDYRDALQELRSSTNDLRNAAAARGTSVPMDGQLGFRARPRADSTAIASSTLSDARTTLSTTVDRTLAGIVDESRGVAVAVWEAASDLPGAKVLEDMIGLARDLRFAKGAEIGRLIAYGVARLRRAIDALKRLCRLTGVQDTTQHLEGLWGDVATRGDALRLALLGAYGAKPTLAAKQAAIVADLPIRDLDEASKALDALRERFQASMQIARRLLRALVAASAFLGALVALVPAANLHHLALAASGYLLLLTGVVLTGRDYMDSGTVLGRVQGVRSVLAELAV